MEREVKEQFSVAMAALFFSSF